MDSKRAEHNHEPWVNQSERRRGHPKGYLYGPEVEHRRTSTPTTDEKGNGGSVVVASGCRRASLCQLAFRRSEDHPWVVDYARHWLPGHCDRLSSTGDPVLKRLLVPEVPERRLWQVCREVRWWCRQGHVEHAANGSRKSWRRREHRSDRASHSALDFARASPCVAKELTCVVQ